MSMKRGLIGIALASFFGGTLIAACDGFDDGACITDSDCIVGEEVCLASTNQCTEICADDTECWGDDECRPRPGSASDIKVCLPPQSTGNGGGEEGGCTEHSDCDEAAGEFCDTATNECRPPINEFEGYDLVLIEDRTEGARCEDKTWGWETAGVKLTDVVLLDGNDQIVGFGEAVETEIGDNSWYGHPEDILTGNAPNFEGRCPTLFEDTPYEDGSKSLNTNFNEDTVAALGCGGKVFIRFTDGSGNYIPFDDSNKIAVYTYGKECSEDVSPKPQSEDDPYDISVCTHTDINECTLIKSGVQGISNTPVSGS